MKMDIRIRILISTIAIAVAAAAVFRAFWKDGPEELTFISCLMSKLRDVVLRLESARVDEASRGSCGWAG